MHIPVPFASAPLAETLIASVWQGALLTAVVALVLRLFPALSAAARSAVWTAVLFLVLGLSILPAMAGHPAVSSVRAVHLAETSSAVLVVLWAFASAWRLVQLGGSALRLREVLRRAVPANLGPDLAAALQPLLTAGSRHVALCTSDLVDRPSVAGFFRPRILLPPALLRELSQPELTQIVLHELEHLRRGDDWINLLGQLSLALLPLNPALLWLNRRLSLERELACDDRVLAATRGRKAYAACLARVAQSSLVQRGVSLALGVLGRRPELVARVERILHAPRPAMGRTQTRFATGLLLAGIAGGAAVLAHSPELVTFNPSAPAATFAQAAETPFPAMPVSSRLLAAQTPHEVLTRANVSASSGALHPFAPLTLGHVQTGRVRRAHAPRLRRAAHILLTNDRLPASPTWVAQQNWGAAPAVAAPARLTEILFTGAGNEQVWYTAIAWRGGWLVVQL